MRSRSLGGLTLGHTSNTYGEEQVFLIEDPMMSGSVTTGGGGYTTRRTDGNTRTDGNQIEDEDAFSQARAQALTGNLNVQKNDGSM